MGPWKNAKGTQPIHAMNANKQHYSLYTPQRNRRVPMSHSTRECKQIHEKGTLTPLTSSRVFPKTSFSSQSQCVNPFCSGLSQHGTHFRITAGSLRFFRAEYTGCVVLSLGVLLCHSHWKSSVNSGKCLCKTTPRILLKQFISFS